MPRQQHRDVLSRIWIMTAGDLPITRTHRKNRDVCATRGVLKDQEEGPFVRFAEFMVSLDVGHRLPQWLSPVSARASTPASLMETLSLTNAASARQKWLSRLAGLL
jgi:hypothetical protein